MDTRKMACKAKIEQKQKAKACKKFTKPHGTWAWILFAKKFGASE
jgi:hypothetical protein